MTVDDQLAARAVVRATSEAIHTIGGVLYGSPEGYAWAAESGWTNPFAFYFAGRGGMLGDVGADAVTAVMGWFDPALVEAMFNEGAAVAGARAAAVCMAEGHGRWGDEHYGRVEGIDEIVLVTEELVDGLDSSGIPLFAGWRAAPPSASAAGRAAQLMQVLREWRGGLHLVATTAVGLTPLEAVLTNQRSRQATFMGWSEPYPDCSALEATHREAEEMTDRLCATALARALDPARYSAFEDGIATLRAATPSRFSGSPTKRPDAVTG